jgi:hypothetical protein
VNSIDEAMRKKWMWEKEMYEKAIAYPDRACPRTTPQLKELYERRLKAIDTLLSDASLNEAQRGILEGRLADDDAYHYDKDTGEFMDDSIQPGIPFVGSGEKPTETWPECNPETTTDEEFRAAIQRYEPMLRSYLKEERERRKYDLANPPTEADKAYAKWWIALPFKERQRVPDHGKLEWIVLQIKRKRFKTTQQLAKANGESRSWADLIKEAATRLQLITVEEWTDSFRKRGRPKKGKPRGPYKKRQLTSS